MKISGFSFCRNAIKLYYPVVESIRSALPIVDEFVVAVGESEDDTLDAIRGIGDPKIRIIETQWDPQHFVRGAINAIQTDIALQACTGDWCLYLQADEKYSPPVTGSPAKNASGHVFEVQDGFIPGKAEDGGGKVFPYLVPDGALP